MKKSAIIHCLLGCMISIFLFTACGDGETISPEEFAQKVYGYDNDYDYDYDDDDYDDEVNSIQCVACKGRGDCYFCGGDGIAATGRVCDYCDGSGICHHCDGAGQIYF